MFNDRNKTFSVSNDSIRLELRIYFIYLCVANLKLIFTKKYFHFFKSHTHEYYDFFSRTKCKCGKCQLQLSVKILFSPLTIFLRGTYILLNLIGKIIN